MDMNLIDLYCHGTIPYGELRLNGYYSDVFDEVLLGITPIAEHLGTDVEEAISWATTHQGLEAWPEPDVFPANVVTDYIAHMAKQRNKKAMALMLSLAGTNIKLKIKKFWNQLLGKN